MPNAIRSLWAQLMHTISPPYPTAEIVVVEIRTLTAESDRRLRAVIEQLDRLEMECRRERTDT